MATVWTDTPAHVDAVITVQDVEAAKRGDRNAYARLVQRHQRVVSSITLAITTDVVASEDAAQEAFLAGWRDLSRLDNPESFGPWICQIARNRAHDILRSRKKTTPAAPDELEGAAAADPDALEALLEAETERLISGALLALPEESREVMILFYREGQSVAEVAAVLGVSEDVVKKRMSRARERIRKSVETALGAALIATIPVSNLFVDAIAEIGTATPLTLPRSWPGLGSIASKTAQLGMAGAVLFMGAQILQQKTIVTTPSAVSISAPAAPRARGTFTGAKNVSGSITFTFDDEVRTIPIVGGAFDIPDLPTGRCRVTLTLDNHPSPPPRDVTFRPGELVEFRLRLIEGTTPGDQVRWQ